MDPRWLREQADALGVNPDAPDRVVDLAAVGVTRIAWRDSPVEDWHARPVRRISQGEMMRANAATTRLVRELINTHTPRAIASSGLGAGDGGLFAAVCRAMASRDRFLPDGRTLAEVAPDGRQLELLDAHVQACCDYWDLLTTEYDVATVLLMLATAGAGLCRRWWLAPHWPRCVDEFISRIDDPDRWDDHVMIGTTARLPRPAEAVDSDWLRRQLRDGPDQVSAGVAAYCLQRGLGAVPVPVKPPGIRRALSKLVVCLLPHGYLALPPGHPDLLLRPVLVTKP